MKTSVPSTPSLASTLPLCARILLSVATFLIAFTVSAKATSSTPETPFARPVKELVLTNGVIQIGTWRGDVLDLIGTPTTRLSNSTWLYDHRFRVDSEVPDPHCCTTLLITFKGQNVVDLKLVNGAGASLIAKAENAGRPVHYQLDPTTQLASDEPATGRASKN